MPMPAPAVSEDDIGTKITEFRVRDDYSSAKSVSSITATLWALGSKIAIYVDDEVPIDWDYECDGVVDSYAVYDSYGFTNCDLQTVADIVDNNIIVNVDHLFGEPSDINEDGKITVLVSPVLNTLPLTSDDEDDWSKVFSYADPESDLSTFDDKSNPSSDEQEIIYVFAPDPYGFYNPYKTTTVDEYTTMELTAEIARSYLRLVLYNTHVIASEGEEEESWLTEALGALATDICGFGAVYYEDAWNYMDAPYLEGLTDYDSSSLFATGSRGAQYLFARWLIDTYGTDLLTSLTNTTEIGAANIEAATGRELRHPRAPVAGRAPHHGGHQQRWRVPGGSRGVASLRRGHGDLRAYGRPRRAHHRHLLRRQRLPDRLQRARHEPLDGGRHHRRP
jgi:hypothetical protein